MKVVSTNSKFLIFLSTINIQQYCAYLIQLFTPLSTSKNIVRFLLDAKFHHHGLQIRDEADPHDLKPPPQHITRDYYSKSMQKRNQPIWSFSTLINRSTVYHTVVSGKVWQNRTFRKSRMLCWHFKLLPYSSRCPSMVFCSMSYLF